QMAESFDVEDLAAGTGGDDPLHKGVGIAGPGPVGSLGVQPERLRHLPRPMRLIGDRGRMLQRFGGHALTVESGPTRCARAAVRRRRALPDGPNALTSRTLTTEAGCAEGVLYRHFAIGAAAALRKRIA